MRCLPLSSLSSLPLGAATCGLQARTLPRHPALSQARRYGAGEARGPAGWPRGGQAGCRAGAGMGRLADLGVVRQRRARGHRGEGPAGDAGPQSGRRSRKGGGELQRTRGRRRGSGGARGRARGGRQRTGGSRAAAPRKPALARPSRAPCAPHPRVPRSWLLPSKLPASVLLGDTHSFFSPAPFSQ